jgi:hypothetical protein
VKIVVRGAKFFDRRVAARVPIHRHVIDSSDRLYVFRYLVIEPTECKVRLSIRCDFRRHDGRIALRWRVGRNWEAFFVLKFECDTVLTIIKIYAL